VRRGGKREGKGEGSGEQGDKGNDWEPGVKGRSGAENWEEFENCCPKHSKL